MNLQKTLTVLWLAAWALFFAARHEKARLPAARALKAELRQVPVQKETAEQPFSFAYRGRPYDVKPLAAYELWGVIVSRNDIGSIADIYHTGDAVDTTDVCVAWGENAATDDLSKVKFWNGPFTCYFRYPEDAGGFKPGDVSNNHLVTKDAAVRERINGLAVGDQVRLKGLLVSYRPADEPDNWRTSSLTRSDTGPGACEVVYVRELDVLEPNAPGWRSLWKGARISLLAIPLLKGLLLLMG
jgi:hypothetical protein